MMFGKIDRYLLIAILIVALVAVYFLFTNKKDTNDQSNLLLAMAEKLGSLPAKTTTTKPQKEKVHEPVKEIEPTEEEWNGIVAVSDKLCFGKPLNDEEDNVLHNFKPFIDRELSNSKKALAIIINKFLTGITEFDDFEKEFYTANQEDIDTIVQNKKYFDSIVKKINDRTDDLSEEELQYKNTYNTEIERELDRINNKGALKGANPPLAAGERLRTILAFFDDGIPRTVTELANLYAEKTNTKVSRGNMSTLFGKLTDQGKLLCTKAGKDNKIYHGLPEWFDGKKLKPEYKQKITS